MAETISDVLSYSELELTVRTFEKSKIEDLGTLGWYQAHERMQKLSQQAIVEIRTEREDNVIGLLASNDKVAVLVHEAICIRVWREKVLPHILSTHLSETAHGFMPYLIIFHEAVAVSLLETILFSPEACSALGDAAPDLVDFTAQSLARLMAGPGPDRATDLELGTRDQLEQQQRALEFSIGIRSVSIVRYLATNIDSLAVSATTRMLETHDLPVVLAALLDRKPWVRRDSQGQEQFLQDDEWRPVLPGGEMPRCEAQAWLALHQLLLSPPAMADYQLTAGRLSAFAKLQRLLVESVVDQLSPLMELQHWLVRAQTGGGAAPGNQRCRPVILELQAEIRAAVEAGRSTKKWKSLAAKQSERLFGVELMQQVACRMSETYDLELLDALRPTSRRCSACGAETTQRCSRCKTFYYCSRPCQVRDWKKHKTHCDKIVLSTSGDSRT